MGSKTGRQVHEVIAIERIIVEDVRPSRIELQIEVSQRFEVIAKEFMRAFQSQRADFRNLKHGFQSWVLMDAWQVRQEVLDYDLSSFVRSDFAFAEWLDSPVELSNMNQRVDDEVTGNRMEYHQGVSLKRLNMRSNLAMDKERSGQAGRKVFALQAADDLRFKQRNFAASSQGQRFVF